MSSVALTPPLGPVPLAQALVPQSSDDPPRRLRLAERIALLSPHALDPEPDDATPLPAASPEPAADREPEAAAEANCEAGSERGPDVTSDATIAGEFSDLDVAPAPPSSPTEPWMFFGLDLGPEPTPSPVVEPEAVLQPSSPPLPPPANDTDRDDGTSPAAEEPGAAETISVAAAAAMAAALAAAARSALAASEASGSVETRVATEPEPQAMIENVMVPGPQPSPAMDEQEARTVAAATELVSLLAQQRSLLDAMTRLAGDAWEPQPAAPPLREAATHTEPAPPSTQTVAAPTPAFAPPHVSPAADQDRPPIIIERAHAAQRAGETVFDGPYVELPSRLPAFATGFALAMLTGGALYVWRLAG